MREHDFFFLSPAEELIRHWLAGVERATSPSHGAEREEGLRTGSVSGERTNVEKEDFLSSVDWVSGDVGQSTKYVLRGLLSKELKCEDGHQGSAKKKSYNPLITMEMRHKQVRHTYLCWCMVYITLLKLTIKHSSSIMCHNIIII